MDTPEKHGSENNNPDPCIEQNLQQHCVYAMDQSGPLLLVDVLSKTGHPIAPNGGKITAQPDRDNKIFGV